MAIVLADVMYVRGWDDCLEAMRIIIEKAKNQEELKMKIAQLHTLIREDKFEKIRYELGAYNIF